MLLSQKAFQCLLGHPAERFQEYKDDLSAHDKKIEVSDCSGIPVGTWDNNLSTFNGHFRNRLIGGTYHIWGLWKAYAGEHLSKLWPETWYSTSILNSHWHVQIWTVQTSPLQTMRPYWKSWPPRLFNTSSPKQVSHFGTSTSNSRHPHIAMENGHL